MDKDLIEIRELAKLLSNTGNSALCYFADCLNRAMHEREQEIANGCRTSEEMYCMITGYDFRKILEDWAKNNKTIGLS